jgi:hypothetical protein
MYRIVLFLLVLPGTVLAIEKLEYQALEPQDSIELRQYPAHNLVVTEVKGGFKTAGSEGFRRLVAYIFGSNANNQKIAMTAPIMQSSIAVDQYQLSLFMPAQFSLSELPEPTDSRVKIVRVPASIMAVRAYKGGWAEKTYEKHRRALVSALSRTAILKVAGDPVWARYNRPLCRASCVQMKC